MQDDLTIAIDIEEISLNDQARLGPVTFVEITSAQQASTLVTFHGEEVDVKANQGRGDEEQVDGLSEDEAQEVRVIATSHAIVQPLTVMVEPIDTLIAYETVSATWQDYDRTCGAHLLHIKFLQQVHHGDPWFSLDHARAAPLDQYHEQDPEAQKSRNSGLEPLLLWPDHVWENQNHQKQVTHDHGPKEAKHSPPRSPNFMNRLLKFERAFYSLHTALINVHNIFEQIRDHFQPILIFDLIFCILEWGPPLPLCDERIRLLHKKKANDRRGTDLFRLRNCQMQWCDTTIILKIHVWRTGQ